MSYRGRIAPSPTGLLHLGHAATFWIAYQRSIAASEDASFLRMEDLDPQRSKPNSPKRPSKTSNGWESAGRRARMPAAHCAPYSKANGSRSIGKRSARLIEGRIRLPLPLHPQRPRATGAGSARRRADCIRNYAGRSLNPVDSSNRTRGDLESTGGFASRTARDRSSTTSTLARNASSPEKTSATSSSGAKMECPPINSPSPSTTPRWQITEVVRGADLLKVHSPPDIWSAARLDCPSRSGITVRSSPTKTAKGSPNATTPSVLER
jgi:hypothetical protein